MDQSQQNEFLFNLLTRLEERIEERFEHVEKKLDEHERRQTEQAAIFKIIAAGGGAVGALSALWNLMRW